LVEAGHSPIAIRQTRKAEGAIARALGKREVFAVRIAKAHVALGEGEAIVRTAAVESFIRRAAHALGYDPAGQGIGATRARNVRVSAGANARQASLRSEEHTSELQSPDQLVC